MKREDLKTGMVVVLKNGKELVVMLDTPTGDLLVGQEFGNIIYKINEYLNEDLTDRKNPDYTIVKVYKPKSLKDLGVKSKLLWTREELVKEMTIEAIEKVLGHKVKVVGA